MLPPPAFSRRRFILGLAASAGVVTLPTIAQDGLPASPPLVLDASLEDLAALLDERVPASLATNHVPGCSLALIREGRVAWTGAWGVRSARTGAPVDTFTIFEAASLTKPLFAATVMTFVEEGRLSLDQPLGDILDAPYVDDPSVQKKIEKLTPRLVLTHRTGLPNWRGTNPLSFLHEPDTQWSYSGEGFVLLQIALETMTGDPLEKIVYDRVLFPMGLLRTRLTWTGFESSNAADSHTFKGESRGKKGWHRASAPSSLHTTPADYAYFMRLFMPDSLETYPSPLPEGSEGAPQFRNLPGSDSIEPVTPLPPPARFLSPDSIAALLTPRTEVDDPAVRERILWGLGWGLQESADGRAFWHWGNNQGFKSFCIGYPELGLGAVICTNADYGWKVHREIIPLALGGDPTALNWKV